MTTDECRKISVLRLQGYGYKKIAAETGLNVNTIKSYFKAHPSTPASGGTFCKNCGEPIKQTPQKREKKFCSDKCRAEWWTAHPEARKTPRHAHECRFCGREFFTDRSASQFCSVRCFADARRKEAVK